jgi:hypothetical protein
MRTNKILCENIMNHIVEVEKYFGCTLPKTYRQFLLSFDKELDGDVYLYLPDMLIERNECYQTKEYAPDYINIGSDGGGMAFILKLSDQDPKVALIDHGSMDPELSEFVCSSFSEWVASDFEYDEE